MHSAFVTVYFIASMQNILISSLSSALQESLMLSSFGGASRTSPTPEQAEGDDFDENLELALRLSRAEKLKENDLLMEETRMIEMAIKKSLEER